MDNEEILKEFESAGAIIRGHFVLSSGLHSDTYMQCARALMDPKRAEKLCSALAEKIEEKIGRNSIDMIVAPATGGIVVGYEMGRQLGIITIFCEREDGKFVLRRGFEIPKGARVLIVEDVVTTGKSSLETVICVQENGGKVIGEACLINRSGMSDPLDGIPLIPLAEITVKTYHEVEVPDSLKAVPAVKPGSRWLKK